MWCATRVYSCDPYYFLIYVNDLPHTSNLTTRLFADDTVLTLSDQTAKNLYHNVNYELAKIEHWMKINK